MLSHVVLFFQTYQNQNQLYLAGSLHKFLWVNLVNLVMGRVTGVRVLFQGEQGETGNILCSLYSTLLFTNPAGLRFLHAQRYLSAAKPSQLYLHSDLNTTNPNMPKIPQTPKYRSRFRRSLQEFQLI